MTRPVGIGIVGIGFGQHVHVPAFRADARCRVTAICASTRQRAAAVADRLDIPRAYGDWREMMADPEVDIVSVAVPPVVQCPVVIEAVKAGKAVFCEKPAAADSRHAEAMLAAAERAGVSHGVDFLFPEIPVWQKTKAVVDSGALGRLRHAYLSWRVETYALRTKSDSWKLRLTDGGGTLNSFASHSLYYLEWLFGPISAVTTRLSPPQPVTDVRVDAWLEFASGLPVSISVAADAFLGTGHRLEIYGDDGAMVLENLTADYARGFRLSLGTRRSGTMEPLEVESDDAPGDGRVAAVNRIVRRLVDATPGGGTITPNLSHALRVQRLIDAMRESDRAGQRRMV